MQKFYLAWDDKLHNLGIASIDSQHRALVDLVNALSESVAQGCDCEQAMEHMEAILQSATAHFAHEEDLMHEHGFPGVEKHADEHAELLEKARTLMQTANNPTRAVLITAFLTDCVEQHILKDDVALVRHLHGRGLS